jgi:anti-sigma regulatory factor (Ser/Thr protein kinase)
VPLRLSLDPEPHSPARARAWICLELTQLNRPELIESAQLALSELVTNAILHARTPIQVTVVPQGESVRIEVQDGSPRHPATRTESRDGLDPPTVGRGIHIVEAVATEWGVRRDRHQGKVVWFSPAASRERTQPLLTARASAGHAHRLPGQASAVVKLTDVPVRPTMYVRARYRDLRRELVLISLRSDHDLDTVAHQLTRVADEIDRARRVSLSGSRALDDAFEQGQDRVDLAYRAPVAAAPLYARLGELLMEANTYCLSRRLLTLAASEQEQALRAWLVGEFVNQLKGADPLPWTGPIELE